MPYYTGLARVARKTGYPVVEVAGWKTRGHGPMRGCKTIVAHHTATSAKAKGNYPSLAVVRDGRKGLTGPLSQYGLGRDGTIYVIAAGLSYHTGQTWKPEQSNSYAIGIEAEHDGSGVGWSENQMDSYVKLCRALIDEFGLKSSDVLAHREIAKPKGRKPDPAGIDMTDFRKAVERGYWITDQDKAWPEADIEPSDKHTGESHEAWVRLLKDVGYGDSKLGLAFQKWLSGLGLYKGAFDGVVGPVTVKALQTFLKNKKHYSGVVDGSRGPMTVRAEIAYLNDQRKYY